ncbi:MAG: 4Fe-4S binding protein [Candidatus Thermoplasmatota archaeon]|nr:4Fe-4S binding protein [Candidatus Thermoplasmatota archaeon]
MVKKEFEEDDIKIIVDYDKCNGAGECVAVCPVDIFSLDNGKAVCVDVGECIECCACVSSCPQEAIEHSSC